MNSFDLLFKEFENLYRTSLMSNSYLQYMMLLTMEALELDGEKREVFMGMMEHVAQHIRIKDNKLAKFMPPEILLASETLEAMGIRDLRELANAMDIEITVNDEA